MPAKNTNTLSAIEIAPESVAKRSIIWLHGLGADGTDFVPIVSELHLPAAMGVRFIFPHAPIMPITINNGYEMRAWYDIASLTIDGMIDKTGILRSIHQLEMLIEKEEARGMATRDIMLAGFSQGAAIALATGVRYTKPLGGIIALSGYLPLAQETFEHASKANQSIPIFLAHGMEDPIVPYALGKASYVMLKQANYPVSWHSYNMPHSVCAAEIQDLSNWLKTVWNK